MAHGATCADVGSEAERKLGLWGPATADMMELRVGRRRAVSLADDSTML